MKCPIIPLGDKVVVLPLEEGEQMYGNIIVPDAGQEKPEMGTVMAVGEGRVTNEGAIIQNQLEVLIDDVERDEKMTRADLIAALYKLKEGIEDYNLQKDELLQQ